MNLNIGTTNVLSVSYTSDYEGRPVTYVDDNGITRTTYTNASNQIVPLTFRSGTLVVG
jgi:hypothetical protein